MGGIKIVRVKAFMLVLQDGYFLFGRRIANFDLEQKTVKLRFRQRISAFKLNWILCGKDGKKL